MMILQEQPSHHSENTQDVSRTGMEQKKEVIMTQDERNEAVANQMRGLMERLAKKIDKVPSLKVALVTLALLTPAQKAEAGFFEDAVGIIADSVGRTVGRKVQSAEQGVRDGINDSVYKACSKVGDSSMREVCYDAFPRIVDRAIESARTGVTHPTPSTIPSRSRSDRGIVWE